MGVLGKSKAELQAVIFVVGWLMLGLPMTANGEPGVVSIFAAICLTIEHLSFHGEQRAKQQNKTEQPQEKEEERAN